MKSGRPQYSDSGLAELIKLLTTSLSKFIADLPEKEPSKAQPIQNLLKNLTELNKKLAYFSNGRTPEVNEFLEVINSLRNIKKSCDLILTDSEKSGGKEVLNWQDFLRILFNLIRPTLSFQDYVDFSRLFLKNQSIEEVISFFEPTIPVKASDKLKYILPIKDLQQESKGETQSDYQYRYQWNDNIEFIDVGALYKDFRLFFLGLLQGDHLKRVILKEISGIIVEANSSEESKYFDDSTQIKKRLVGLSQAQEKLDDLRVQLGLMMKSGGSNLFTEELFCLENVEQEILRNTQNCIKELSDKVRADLSGAEPEDIISYFDKLKIKGDAFAKEIMCLKIALYSEAIISTTNNNSSGSFSPLLLSQRQSCLTTFKESVEKMDNQEVLTLVTHALLCCEENLNKNNEQRELLKILEYYNECINTLEEQINKAKDQKTSLEYKKGFLMELESRIFCTKKSFGKEIKVIDQDSWMDLENNFYFLEQERNEIQGYFSKYRGVGLTYKKSNELFVQAHKIISTRIERTKNDLVQEIASHQDISDNNEKLFNEAKQDRDNLTKLIDKVRKIQEELDFITKSNEKEKKDYSLELNGLLLEVDRIDAKENIQDIKDSLKAKITVQLDLEKRRKNLLETYTNILSDFQSATYGEDKDELSIQAINEEAITSISERLNRLLLEVDSPDMKSQVTPDFYEKIEVLNQRVNKKLEEITSAETYYRQKQVEKIKEIIKEMQDKGEEMIVEAREITNSQRADMRADDGRIFKGIAGDLETCVDHYITNHKYTKEEFASELIRKIDPENNPNISSIKHFKLYKIFAAQIFLALGTLGLSLIYQAGMGISYSLGYSKEPCLFWNTDRDKLTNKLKETVESFVPTEQLKKNKRSSG